MTVHWHDDEHGWCPCDEITTSDPGRLAAWFHAIRFPGDRLQPDMAGRGPGTDTATGREE